jgi:hypothetical protein
LATQAEVRDVSAGEASAGEPWHLHNHFVVREQVTPEVEAQLHLNRNSGCGRAEGQLGAGAKESDGCRIGYWRCQHWAMSRFRRYQEAPVVGNQACGRHHEAIGFVDEDINLEASADVAINRERQRLLRIAPGRKCN